jgi:hypothetical protein
MKMCSIKETLMLKNSSWRNSCFSQLFHHLKYVAQIGLEAVSKISSRCVVSAVVLVSVLSLKDEKVLSLIFSL